MAEQAVAVRSTRSVSFDFAVCCAGMMSLAIGINLLPPFFTTLQRELGGLTNEEIGRIPSVGFIGVVAAIFLTGPLADRYGAKRFALFGNVLVLVGLLLLSLARAYEMVLAASLFLGVGAGMLDMVLSPIVGALKPENRSSAMNWLHSFYCTGAMATVVIAALALKLGTSWRAVSIALMLLPALVFAGFIRMRVPPLVDESVEGGRMRLRELMRVPYFWGALAAIALGGATEMGMANWLSAYAEKSLGYSAVVGAMALTGFSAAMAVGRIGVGIVGHTNNMIKVLLACSISSVIFFLLASFAPWPGVALTACMLAGLAGSCLWPSMLAVTADRFPRGGATMFGALGAAGNLGCIAMPWLVGVITDALKTSHGEARAMSIGLSIGAVCPFLMALVLLGLRRSGRNAA